ncbi:CYTH and CHAD domain-containing protein [Thiobacillus sp.]
MTTPHPLEIELKLTLPPRQVAAFLKRMARHRTLKDTAPVRQALLTRYYDTPDFALSAQGVALRVRRVGRRWLQTLKTEGERHGGLSQRVEFEMAVSRGAPDWNRFPSEARAYVPEALRAQLVPVFETHFRRTTWLVAGKRGARIEVALDIGEVVAEQDAHVGERSQPICEIELELKSGQPDALFALALDWAGTFDCLPFDISKAERGVRLAHGVKVAPVRSVPLALDHAMSVEDGFVTIVQACLAQFQANLPGVLASDDVEYAHQARVALRRLRVVLRIARKICLLPPDLLQGLRTLAAALGPARDWDVLCGVILPPIAPHYPDADGWQRTMAVMQAYRTAEREAMRKTLLTARPGAWLLALQRWLMRYGWRLRPREVHTSPAGEKMAEAQRFARRAPLDGWARRVLQKGHRTIIRSARAFGRLTPPQRHALRIAVKRQRYAAEFFQTLFDDRPDGHRRRQTPYLTVLRTAQDFLGRAHDTQVASGLLGTARAAPRVLQNEADRSTSGLLETGLTVSFVLGWLAAKQVGTENSENDGAARALLKLKPYW